MARLAIFGGGAFGREVLRLARLSYSEVVFVEDKPAAPIMGAAVIHPSRLRADDEAVFAIASPEVRRMVADRYKRLRAGRIIAGTAIVGDEVEVGGGAIFCDFSMATACARIGRHFHGNIYSYVAHDCVIGDFVTFAPKVCCNGNVHIHDGAYIGTGVVMRQGTADKPLVIGAGAVVGMGAVVTKDVPAGATVVGNPARVAEEVIVPIILARRRQG